MDDVRDTIVSGCLVRDAGDQAEKRLALAIRKGRGNLITNNIFEGRLEIAAGSARITNNLEK